MSFGSGSGAGGQQVDPALQRFISEETEKQKMQVRNVTARLQITCISAVQEVQYLGKY